MIQELTMRPKQDCCRKFLLVQNTGLNPVIPGLAGIFNPEIPGLEKNSGIEIPKKGDGSKGPSPKLMTHATRWLSLAFRFHKI